MSLSSILKEIEINRPNAEAVVSTKFPETYGARVGLKKSAEESIRRLKNDYRDQLLASTVFIVVTGASRDAFTALASADSFGCFVADPEDFYKDVAARVSPPQVKPSLYGREATRSLFSIAQNVLADKCVELGIESYPALAFNDKYSRAVNSAEEFAALLKTAINDQVGSEIVGINAVYSIVDSAITRKHQATVTPVILSTGDDKFALDLKTNLGRLKTKTFLVLAGKTSKALAGTKDAVVVKTVNEESVGEALTAIRNKL